ncbi:multidrug effflux MFS transporter [Streptomyces morookaense]|uniref:Multidrug effflux MFS transporter n=1 Tax=Streptomyces morookaense TaxID=1970 RepID=A0A7Y7E5P7_STRMO|nr:multidrug effflux MFS transporter [Streptomyces morookaense]NVK76576.1 multidrug effflux MFS transporter [Streptomyces morookaense]GHF08091.1 Bcr/CflA family drug resistance efflux transporter [Streptomyces morookaense]
MFWLTAALGLLAFVTPLATDMYLPAFPHLTGELHSSASGIQLTLTAFLLGMGLGQLLIGPLSDRFGRRVPLLAGAAVMVTASALCALAPSLGVLVVLRFVQGFSGSAGVVIGRAVITDVTSGDRAARLFGSLMTLTGLGPIVAPMVGAALTESTGWRGVFWALTGVSALALLGAVIFVPESLPDGKRHTGGPRDTLRAMRGVLGDRAYLGYTLSFGLAFAMLFSYIAGSAFLFQKVLGLSVGHASLAFAGIGVVGTLASMTGTRLVGRYGPERLLRTGLGTMVACTAALCTVSLAGALTLPLTMALLCPVFIGMRLVTANAGALAMARVPHASGSGSAVLGTLQSALSALMAPLVGLGGEHTAVPMFLGMAICAALSSLSLLLTRGAVPVGVTAPATDPRRTAART